MLVVVVILFAFLWLPLYAINVRIFFGPQPDENGVEFDLLTRTLIPLAQWLALSSSSVNPVVYCLFSGKFRAGFLDLVSACCCCGAARRPTPGGVSGACGNSSVQTRYTSSRYCSVTSRAASSTRLLRQVSGSQNGSVATCSESMKLRCRYDSCTADSYTATRKLTGDTFDVSHI